MKKKFKILSLFLPLVVVFAILFPAIHSYEHIQNHNSSHKSIKLQFHTNKADLKVHDHSNEECAICHFKFSPVATFTFDCFQFYKNSALIHTTHFYSKSFSEFFKGSLFSLRAPPVF
ncbi:hypothetical protein SAMN05444366_1464 [Flavobacterium saccharophilum]|uniref:Uncharacterized protein n=1 Tax=Flavobacterium saccharophilum TaxID=29534 RepID=A0A1M7D9I3_9FLAO|nr:hypothetical protein SAMN05444366_1464 [Flavobacterium saccharophilum]